MAISIPAKPYAFPFDPERAAILAIDLQKDFLEPGGFGEAEGGEAFQKNRPRVSELINSIKDLFDAARFSGVSIVHTRVGHSPDLSDLAFHKAERQKRATGAEGRKLIGDRGPRGRMLVRGEQNQDIVDVLKPHPGEYVLDKTGTGAFYHTGLDAYLSDRQITHLILVGCTTECCVFSTLREANDRGYECCVLTQCVTGFLPKEEEKACLDLISFSNGLFGFVSDAKDALVSQLLALGQQQSQLAYAKSPDDFIGSIQTLQTAYRHGRSHPLQVIQLCFHRIRHFHEHDQSVFIHLFEWPEILGRVKALLTKYSDRKALPPLFCVPYVIKDNIDVTGVATTAACPTLNYIPAETATCVKRLEAAGAILLGKTNMDQFATGLVGMRSPYGNPSSAYSDSHIAGGSSCGSAVAVGRRLVTFALGTDTAASVRVPAAYNGVVGWKPTRGSSSIHGIIPASPSLDCVGVFAQDARSAWDVWMAIRGHDPLDLYSDPRADGPRLATRFAGRFAGRAMHGRPFTFATPSEDALNDMCPEYRPLFRHAIQAMEALGGKHLANFDWRPFELAQKELYGSARMAERGACLRDFFKKKGISFQPDQMHPITRQAVKDLQPDYTASSAFEVMAELRRLSANAREAWRIDADGKPFEAPVDVLLTPTAPFHPTKADVQESPLALNGKLGIYSQAVNLLNMCAVAVPFADFENAAFSSGYAPFGVQLICDQWEDGFLLALAERLMKRDSDD